MNVLQPKLQGYKCKTKPFVAKKSVKLISSTYFLLHLKSQWIIIDEV